MDRVNGVLLSPGDTVIVEQMSYDGAITRLKRLAVNGALPLPLAREGWGEGGHNKLPL